MSAARIALVSVAVVLALAIASVVVLASIDQRALTERVVDRVVAGASESLGREVTFEGARGRLLPDARVTIEGLRVAGRAGEPPLVEVDELQVQLRTWPILRSLGREVAIREVAAVRPSVQLIRDAEGSWNVEDLARERAGAEAEVTLARLETVDGTVSVIDRGAQGASETAVALTDVDAEAEMHGRALSRLRVRAALASRAQNLDVDLAFDVARGGAGVAHALEGGFPRVRGTIALRDADLVRLGGVVPAGMSRVLRGGRVGVEADVATRDDGHYELRGDARLSGVRMRGGEPAEGSMRVNARVDPASPATFRAEVERASLRGPGVELAGSGTFTASPRRVTFDAHGPLLDLDVLLAAMPEGAKRADEGRRDVVPPGVRRTLEDTSARGTVRFDRVVSGPLELQDLAATARLRAGVLELEAGEAKLYGGRVVASGTRVDLGPEVPAWTLRARLESVDVAAMTRDVSGDEPLIGALTGRIDATGAGARWEDVQSSAGGSGVIELHDGTLTTGDLSAAVATAAGDALRLAGRGSARVDAVREGRTDLGALRIAFRIEQGSVVLRQPLTVEAPFGAARLDGRIGLDRSLELSGTAVLSPDFIDEIAGVRPAGPIEVPLSIGGSLSEPEVSLSSEALASALSETALREGARVLEQELGERAGEGLRDLGRRIPIPGL
ncbi:AsmA family protein [Sandaracinus amylolyticus]|uniref:AsmA family protein n=1 Tax=Sandaracinus amylolyticus TaxID=927083 RepID=UPI0014702D05|nr:AsmA family protein [Sandaracinus amylolyticus]